MNKKGVGPQDLAGVLILLLMLWAVFDPLRIIIQNIRPEMGMGSILFRLIPVAIVIMIFGGMLGRERGG